MDAVHRTRESVLAETGVVVQPHHAFAHAFGPSGKAPAIHVGCFLSHRRLWQMIATFPGDDWYLMRPFEPAQLAAELWDVFPQARSQRQEISRNEPRFPIENGHVVCA
jgi:hypothetical protein